MSKNDNLKKMNLCFFLIQELCTFCFQQKSEDFQVRVEPEL